MEVRHTGCKSLVCLIFLLFFVEIWKLNYGCGMIIKKIIIWRLIMKSKNVNYEEMLKAADDYWRAAEII